MSNYVKTTDFASKDALPHGNTLKQLKGVELGTEFDAIATMSGTKEDKTNKGVASGYCDLDASVLIPVARIPSLPASIITSGAFSSGQIPSLDASKITTGAFGAARLGSGTPTSGNWLRGDGAWVALATVATSGAYTDLSGRPSLGTVAALNTDANTNHFLRGDGSFTTVGTGAITGLATSATTDTTNAANISSGTIPNGRLPNVFAGPGVTIQSDPGGTPTGTFGQVFFYY